MTELAIRRMKLSGPQRWGLGATVACSIRASQVGSTVGLSYFISLTKQTEAINLVRDSLKGAGRSILFFYLILMS